MPATRRGSRKAQQASPALERQPLAERPLPDQRDPERERPDDDRVQERAAGAAVGVGPPEERGRVEQRALQRLGEGGDGAAVAALLPGVVAGQRPGNGARGAGRRDRDPRPRAAVRGRTGSPAGFPGSRRGRSSAFRGPCGVHGGRHGSRIAGCPVARQEMRRSPGRDRLQCRAMPGNAKP